MSRLLSCKNNHSFRANTAEIHTISAIHVRKNCFGSLFSVAVPLSVSIHARGDWLYIGFARASGRGRNEGKLTRTALYPPGRFPYGGLGAGTAPSNRLEASFGPWVCSGGHPGLSPTIASRTTLVW